MLLFYGRRNKRIKSYTDVQNSCVKCKSYDLNIRVFRQYGHIYFIPFFPVGDNAVLANCNSCGEPMTVKSVLDHHAASTKTPLYLYAGWLIPLAFIFFIISSKTTTSNDQAGVDLGTGVIEKDTSENLVTNIPADKVFAYNKILKSLGKNYVLNITTGNKVDLLSFYNKSSSRFALDSADYFKGVNDFFSADSLIIKFLILRFRADSSRCSWIYSRDPYSSNLKDWELNFSKEQGAIVLIHDYVSTPAGKGRITTDPAQIETLIENLNMQEVSKWLQGDSFNVSRLSERLKH